MAKHSKWAVGGSCTHCGNPILMRDLATSAPETKRTCACVAQPFSWPYYTNPWHYSLYETIGLGAGATIIGGAGGATSGFVTGNGGGCGGVSTDHGVTLTTTGLVSGGPGRS